MRSPFKSVFFGAESLVESGFNAFCAYTIYFSLVDLLARSLLSEHACLRGVQYCILKRLTARFYSLLVFAIKTLLWRQ